MRLITDPEEQLRDTCRRKDPNGVAASIVLTLAGSACLGIPCIELLTTGGYGHLTGACSVIPGVLFLSAGLSAWRKGK